jgi:small-conductance mechanosensitive channel
MRKKEGMEKTPKEKKKNLTLGQQQVLLLNEIRKNLGQILEEIRAQNEMVRGSLPGMTQEVVDAREQDEFDQAQRDIDEIISPTVAHDSMSNKGNREQAGY